MSSMDGLKRQIEAGEYAPDAREIAGAILDKLALIKTARREMADAEDDSGGEAARASKRRGRRGATPANGRSRARSQRRS
jgi:hypothetical protein